MPGERMGDTDSPIIKLLLALEKFGKQFPGFEREVHGIELGTDGEYWMRSVIESAGPVYGKKAASPARNTKRRGKKAVSSASVSKGTI
jgi:arginine decarboxylase